MTIDVQLWQLAVSVLGMAALVGGGLFAIGRTLGRQEVKTDSLYRAIEANLASIRSLFEAKADKEDLQKAQDSIQSLWTQKVDKDQCQQLRDMCRQELFRNRKTTGGIAG